MSLGGGNLLVCRVLRAVLWVWLGYVKPWLDYYV